MSSSDGFHANKIERLRSCENTVKNIFDGKLKSSVMIVLRKLKAQKA